jgi:hypothetical protein
MFQISTYFYNDNLTLLFLFLRGQDVTPRTHQLMQDEKVDWI